MTLKKDLKMKRKKKSEKEKSKNLKNQESKVVAIMQHLLDNDVDVYNEIIFRWSDIEHLKQVGCGSTPSILKMYIEGTRNRIQKHYEEIDEYRRRHTEDLVNLIKLFAILDFANINNMSFDAALSVFPEINEKFDVDKNEITQLYTSLQKQPKNTTYEYSKNLIQKIIINPVRIRNHIVFYEALAAFQIENKDIDVDEIMRVYQNLQKQIEDEIKQKKTQNEDQQRYSIIQPTWKPYDDKQFIVRMNTGSLSGYLKFKRNNQSRISFETSFLNRQITYNSSKASAISHD